jgi:hypothetical protein
MLARKIEEEAAQAQQEAMGATSAEIATNAYQRGIDRYMAQFPPGYDPLDEFYRACEAGLEPNPERTAMLDEIMAHCKAKTDLGREPTPEELALYIERQREPLN